MDREKTNKQDLKDTVKEQTDLQQSFDRLSAIIIQKQSHESSLKTIDLQSEGQRTNTTVESQSHDQTSMNISQQRSHDPSVESVEEASDDQQGSKADERQFRGRQFAKFSLKRPNKHRPIKLSKKLSGDQQSIGTIDAYQRSMKNIRQSSDAHTIKSKKSEDLPFEQIDDEDSDEQLARMAKRSLYMKRMSTKSKDSGEKRSDRASKASNIIGKKRTDTSMENITKVIELKVLKMSETDKAVEDTKGALTEHTLEGPSASETEIRTSEDDVKGEEREKISDSDSVQHTISELNCE